MSAPRRAALVTPFFVDHDAVCNDVYRSAEAFRRRGWEAAIFAVGGHSAREAARPIAELGAFARDASDLVYFHFSTGRREVTHAIERLRCRKVMKTHNVTPAEFFSLWSDDLAEASRLGRAELPRVAAMEWELALGASAFNLADIAPHLRPGTRRAVVPPFHEVDALLPLAPARGASIAGTPPRLLCVGRIAESKGQAFLLRVLRHLVHDLRVPAMLDIVGKPDHRMVAYQRLLEAMVHEHGLAPNVVFHGEVSPAELAARYAAASVFLTASEHEGFCVPLAEAMAFGVPIVALATSAIPETVGEAAITWEERDPRRFAASVRHLLAHPDEARWLAARGRARYEERFANARIEERLFAALEPAGA